MCLELGILTLDPKSLFQGCRSRSPHGLIFGVQLCRAASTPSVSSIQLPPAAEFLMPSSSQARPKGPKPSSPHTSCARHMERDLQMCLRYYGPARYPKVSGPSSSGICHLCILLRSSSSARNPTQFNFGLQCLKRSGFMGPRDRKQGLDCCCQPYLWNVGRCTKLLPFNLHEPPPPPPPPPPTPRKTKTNDSRKPHHLLQNHLHPKP